MSTCTAACRQAEGVTCHCTCDGRRHGEDAPRQQLVLWVGGSGTVTAPPALLEPEPEAADELPEPATEPLILPAKPSAARPRKRRRSGCDGCHRPWTEVVHVASVDAGDLCSDCAERLWRAS